MARHRCLLLCDVWSSPFLRTLTILVIMSVFQSCALGTRGADYVSFYRPGGQEKPHPRSPIYVRTRCRLCSDALGSDAIIQRDFGHWGAGWSRLSPAFESQLCASSPSSHSWCLWWLEIIHAGSITLYHRNEQMLQIRVLCFVCLFVCSLESQLSLQPLLLLILGGSKCIFHKRNPNNRAQGESCGTFKMATNYVVPPFDRWNLLEFPYPLNLNWPNDLSEQ